MGAYQRFNTGLAFAEASVGVLRDQPSLAVFPLLSSLGVFGFLGLLYESAFFTPSDGGLSLGFVFWAYFGTTFLTAVFNGALAYNAREVFRGRDPGFHEGLIVSFAHVRTLLGYAFVTATVGVILHLLDDSDDPENALVSDFLGFSWAIATYLIVPVIIFEDCSVFGSLFRSANLFKRTWGEGASAYFGIWTFAMAATFSMIIPIAILSILVGGPVLPIGGAVSITMIVIGYLAASALAVVAKTALYFFAISGERPPRFEAVDFMAGDRGEADAVPSFT